MGHTCCCCALLTEYLALAPWGSGLRPALYFYLLTSFRRAIDILKALLSRVTPTSRLSKLSPATSLLTAVSCSYYSCSPEATAYNAFAYGLWLLLFVFKAAGLFLGLLASTFVLGETGLRKLPPSETTLSSRREPTLPRQLGGSPLLRQGLPYLIVGALQSHNKLRVVLVRLLRLLKRFSDLQTLLFCFHGRGERSRNSSPAQSRAALRRLLPCRPLWQPGRSSGRNRAEVPSPQPRGRHPSLSLGQQPPQLQTRRGNHRRSRENTVGWCSPPRARGGASPAVSGQGRGACGAAMLAWGGSGGRGRDCGWLRLCLRLCLLGRLAVGEAVSELSWYEP